MFSFEIFVYLVDTWFHIFIWLNIAQDSASVMLMQKDVERVDHQLDWLQHFPSIFTLADCRKKLRTVPPSVEPQCFVTARVNNIISIANTDGTFSCKSPKIYTLKIVQCLERMTIILILMGRLISFSM